MPSAVCTASAASASSIGQVPRPRAGMVTSLRRISVGTVDAVMGPVCQGSEATTTAPRHRRHPAGLGGSAPRRGMSGPSREGWTMRATTDHRVRRARLLIATAAGGVSGAVAGPLFDLLVPGPFTTSVTLFAVILGAVVGCLSGLLAAVLLNLTLPRTH